MLVRRTFKIDIVLNGRRIKYVVIDPHYELKHAKSMSDSIILDLVGLLDGDYFLPESIVNGYEYFAKDLSFKGKEYRLIWVLEKNKCYIGVINAYRR
jgi:hypothetical protein